MIEHGANILKIGGQAVDRRTVKGIQTASAESGVSFHYLLAKAAQESSFDAKAKASTSSATGLFQFTEGTWLDMVKRHGAALGLDQLAAQIGVTNSGRPYVADEGSRRRILALRENPEMAAQVAARFAADNARSLESTLGRVATSGDLYLAHFLGASGAGKLLQTAAENPLAPAVDLMPAAARANPTVFFGADGASRSVRDLISWIKDRFADRLDETAEVAALLESDTAMTDAPRSSLSRGSTALFDFTGGRETDTAATNSALSLMLLENLSRMIAAQPMEMVDDPFALSPAGIGAGSWSDALFEAFGGDDNVTAAERAYRRTLEAEEAQRRSQSDGNQV